MWRPVHLLSLFVIALQGKTFCVPELCACAPKWNQCNQCSRLSGWLSTVCMMSYNGIFFPKVEPDCFLTNSWSAWFPFLWMLFCSSTVMADGDFYRWLIPIDLAAHTHVTSGGFNLITFLPKLFVWYFSTEVMPLFFCIFTSEEFCLFFVLYHMYRQHESPDHVKDILFFCRLVGLIIWSEFQAHDSVLHDLQCSIIAGLLFLLTATAKCIVPIPSSHHWRRIGIATVIRLLSYVSACQGQGCNVSVSIWGVKVLCCDKTFCRVLFRASQQSKENRTCNHGGGGINGNRWMTNPSSSWLICYKNINFFVIVWVSAAAPSDIHWKRVYLVLI